MLRKKNILIGLVAMLVALPTLFSFKVPGSHERLINKTLRSYERELNSLVIELAKNPKSANIRDFASLYFVTDSTKVLNHIMPENINAPKEVASLANKPILKATEFVKLASGLYKSDFAYEFDFDELVIQGLNENDDNRSYIYQYRISIPAQIQGKVNGQLKVEFKKDIDIFLLVYMDSKRSIKNVRIQQIQDPNSKYIPDIPTHEEPANVVVKPEPNVPTPSDEPAVIPMINWKPEMKQKTVINYLSKAATGVSEEELDKMKKAFEDLFDESGFATIETAAGNSIRVARKALLSRAAKTKASYTIESAVFGHFDKFRGNSRDEMFCRLTTVSDVKSFEAGIPVGSTTVADRMPVKGNTTNSKDYWKIIELVLNEK